MKLPNIRTGSIHGKFLVSSLTGLALASIGGFALINASQTTSTPATPNESEAGIQDIPGITPQLTPGGPMGTWPGDGPSGGIVADTRHFRSYTYVTRNTDGQLQKGHATGTLEDAQEALQNKVRHRSQTSAQTDAQESKEQ